MLSNTHRIEINGGNIMLVIRTILEFIAIVILVIMVFNEDKIIDFEEKIIKKIKAISKSGRKER